MAKCLLVIGGPTASGKTALAIALAERLGAPILSADSRQFYRELRIGVARPSPAELTRAKHHFVADRSVEEPLSAGQFAREALAQLEEIYRENDYALLVGGSGLFVRALTEGLDEFPPVPEQVRAEVNALYETGGLAALQAAVAEADPDYYREVDRQNPARLLRALEVCHASGRPYSSFRREAPAARSFTPVYLQLSWPREALYARINHRVDQMMREGLLEEARAVYDDRHLSALQTVGYQELFDHLEGKTDLATAVELIKRNTRRYAKRQLTWHRRDGFWKLVRAGDVKAALAYLEWINTGGGAIANLSPEEIPVDLPQRKGHESYLVGLRRAPEEAPRAWGHLLQGQEEAWLTHLEWDELPYLGRALLLHQLVHVAERAHVYAAVVEARQRELLLSQGFRPVDGEAEGAPLVWRREDDPLLVDNER